MTARAAHIVGDVKPSGQTHDARIASNTTITKNTLVQVTNPGTSVGVSPAHTDATAVLYGVALETVVNPTGGTKRAKIDIGGAQMVVNVTDDLNADGRNVGSKVIMAGPQTVTLGGPGPRQCGKILEVITGGSGTSTALIKLSAMDHSDTDVSGT